MPYKISWFDSFRNWVGRLPVRAWVFYVTLGIAFVLLQLSFLWVDGGPFAETLLPVIIFNGLAMPFLLGLMHLLDRQAADALDNLRPVLDLSPIEFENRRFQLSNMPVLAPLIAGLALTALTILSPLVSTEPTRYVALEQLPVFSPVFHVVDKGSAFLFGVILYHTIRQLRLVNMINSKHIRVNLFHLKPLQAFSRVTATTAVGLLVFVYVWMLINPELLADPLLVGYVLAFTILATVVFVLPLRGAHRLIQEEKDRVVRKLDLRFEEVVAEFNKSLDESDYAACEELSGTISGLEIQHKRISAVPTWPWSPEAARIALTAIALPLILMIVQFFVLQALDR